MSTEITIPSAKEASEKTEKVCQAKKQENIDKFVPIIVNSINEAVNNGEYCTEIPGIKFTDLPEY